MEELRTNVYEEREEVGNNKRDDSPVTTIRRRARGIKLVILIADSKVFHIPFHNKDFGLECQHPTPSVQVSALKCIMYSLQTHFLLSLQDLFTIIN